MGRSRHRSAKTSNSIHLTRGNTDYFFQIYLEGARRIRKSSEISPPLLCFFVPLVSIYYDFDRSRSRRNRKIIRATTPTWRAKLGKAVLTFRPAAS